MVYIRGTLRYLFVHLRTLFLFISCRHFTSHNIYDDYIHRIREYKFQNINSIRDVKKTLLKNRTYLYSGNIIYSVYITSPEIEEY